MNFQAVVIKRLATTVSEDVSIHWFETLEEVLAFVEIFNKSRHDETVLAMYNSAY